MNEAKSEKLQMLLANEITQDFFHQTLLASSASHAAREFLAQRGIGSEAIESFKIGLAPDDWSILPDYLEAKGVSLAKVSGSQILRTPTPVGEKYAATYHGHLMFPVHEVDGSAVSFVARNFQQSSDYPKYL
jgi:DNA primase